MKRKNKIDKTTGHMAMNHRCAAAKTKKKGGTLKTPIVREVKKELLSRTMPVHG